jgi:hypothetical protein
MALFGKKKIDDTADPASGGGSSGGVDSGKATGASADDGGKFKPDPDKAKRFFEHARAMADSSNYEYAMTLWLQGLRQDPSNMTGLESFFDAAANFTLRNPKSKGPTKDQVKQFSGKTTVDKFLVNLLNWGTRPKDDWLSGLRSMTAAAELGLDEPAFWIGERVFGIARNDPKAKKDHFVELMGLFEKIGGFDKAVLAGEAAMALDPRDAKLEAQVRNMSATATMSRGGYDQTGQAGGFRANVRGGAEMRNKQEEEQIVKSEETLDAIIGRLVVEYEKRPTDEPTVQKLGKALLERGKGDDEKNALKLYLKAYEATKIYRFKEQAGDIKIRIARRKLRALKAQMDADPTNADLPRQYASARTQVLEFEKAEFTERVAAYPTDMIKKFELGVRCFQLGDFEGAIEQFQQAQGASGLGVRVKSYLGQSFDALGWLDEAESSYRAAIEDYPVEGDDLGMELRYGLMKVLERQAREQKKAAAADEAYKLASAIALKQINYRDIRDRRSAIQTLQKEMRGG